MSNRTIIIMAGGTGGHIFPGLSVADELKKKGWHIEWLGTESRMEAQLVPKHGYNINFITIEGVRGKGLLTKLTAPFKICLAVIQAVKLYRQIRPNVVLGMGGYASGPGGIAAKVMGIPLVIHEQNAVFGKTNLLLSKIAKKVLCGFDIFAQINPHKAPDRAEYVGNPIRPDFSALPAKVSQCAPFNILIVGGSLGARALNQEVPKCLTMLSSTFACHISHQCGAGNSELVKQAYKNLHVNSSIDVNEFVDNMVLAFDRADIIICRAGALTVAEVAAAGLPAIFVPLPIAVDDHQTYNAKFLSDAKAAVLLPEITLSGKLTQVLTSLFNQPEKLTTMGRTAKQLGLTNASERVADYCEALAIPPTRSAGE